MDELELKTLTIDCLELWGVEPGEMSGFIEEVVPFPVAVEKVHKVTFEYNYWKDVSETYDTPIELDGNIYIGEYEANGSTIVRNYDTGFGLYFFDGTWYLEYWECDAGTYPEYLTATIYYEEKKMKKFIDGNLLNIFAQKLNDKLTTKINEVNSKTTTLSNDLLSHNHDDKYYTESEVDSKLSTTLDDAKGYVDNQIVNVEKNQYNILENSGLVGREETIITDLSPYNPTMGFITGTGTWGNINEKYQFIVIPITNTGGILSITANDSYATYFAGLRSYTTPIDKSAVDLSEADGWTSRLIVPKSATKQYNIPDDVKYLIVFVVYNTSDCTPANFYLNIPYGKGRVDILEEKVRVLENGHGLKWLALGDSITEGYYSIMNEETEDTESHKSINECYCAWIAKMKGFELDNQGVGGSGWLKRGTTAAPKLNAREQIDAVNEDGTYVIDFTKYDICTIMWGVNDWKGSQNLGAFEDGINPETESVYGNMRYVIETILSRNPSIKLIVITPVNCRQDTSARPSSADNNWGIGFDFGGHTLEDYYDAIKEVCDYYGIEMIDMTHNSIINRINAEAMLPDKVHPSLDAHRQMGLELSGKILYGC